MMQGEYRSSRRAWSICIRRARTQALRLDFFGDEIESVRTFDPQPINAPPGGLTALRPAPRLRNAARRRTSIKRFRSALSRTVRRDRDRRSAVSGDQRRVGVLRGWSIGSRCSRRRWRRCSIISATTPIMVRDAGVGRRRPKVDGSRRSPIITSNRVKRAESSRPGQLPAASCQDALYLTAKDFAQAARCCRPVAYRITRVPRTRKRKRARLRRRRPARLRARSVRAASTSTKRS